jgi:hypothetical protein
MGRKDEQGKHYDHNTGSERAKVVGKAMAKKTERLSAWITIIAFEEVVDSV